MDIEILEDLGLRESEIKVYLALLKIGESSAGKIIEKTNLHNSVVHRSLNSLIENGLVSYILEGKHKVYTSTDPTNFLNFIDDKKKRFLEILPKLQEEQRKQNEANTATLFKGKKGIKEIYNLIIESKGNEYNTFGGGKRVTFDVMGESWWLNFHTKRIAKGIKSRQIFDETLRDFGNNLNKKPLTKIRFLSPEYEQLVETIVYGDYVGIIIFTESPYGLLIKDKIVVDHYKKYFELMWKKAKE